MFTPVSLLEQKCYVVTQDSDYIARAYLANIYSVSRVGRSYVIGTNYGFFAIDSVFVHDDRESAEQVCNIINGSKGGVTHEQKETSDQG